MALISALKIVQIFPLIAVLGLGLFCRPVSVLMLTKWFSANAPVSAF